MTLMEHNTMTVDDWVKFYLDNPDQLRAFIITANEEVNRIADELNSLQAKVPHTVNKE